MLTGSHLFGLKVNWLPRLSSSALSLNRTIIGLKDTPWQNGVVFGRSNMGAGNRYCRRCEVYSSQVGKFCQCCGMTLRECPTNRKQKERLRERLENME